MDVTELAAVLGPLHVVLGLSVLLYADAWQSLAKKWKDDHYQLFGLMFFALFLGFFLVRSYNVWEWNPWLVVTLLGWAYLLKGLFYFLLPGDVLKKFMEHSKNKNLLYFSGLVTLVLGGLLSYYVYFV